MNIKNTLSALMAFMLLASALPASATGLVGSLSGVSDSEDVNSANLGYTINTDDALTGAQDNAGSADAPTAAAAAEPPETPSEAPAVTPPPAAYEMSARERELFERLNGTSLTQEGWHVHFVGQHTMAMIDMPELIVWDIQPENGVMKLNWFRNLYEFMDEGAALPEVSVAPDGAHALVAPADGSVYLIDAERTELIAPKGTKPTDMLWADDALSYAYTVENTIYMRAFDGTELRIVGNVLAPVANEMEWLNPAPVPAALAELMNDPQWTLTGKSSSCMLFDNANDATSCAYIYASGDIVRYPIQLFSADSIGDSGACPIYDETGKRYRLYLNDGAYADIPMFSVINGGEMSNPYGWLGDVVCVLEQNPSARDDFRLHAANTATGITHKLMTPWEYANMTSGNAPADASEP